MSDYEPVECDRQHQFKQWLKTLGVPNELELHADVDIDWMWSDPKCSYLLDWMMKNINENDVVTKTQQLQ